MPAPSVRSATSRSAVRVTTDPSSDTVCPVHSLRKSECCQSDRSVTSGGEYRAHRSRHAIGDTQWEDEVEGAPPQYTIKDLDGYLEQLSRPVFQAGMSWRVI